MSPITHVRHVALAVPDFEKERDFLGGIWGLTEAAGGPDLAFFAAKSSPEPYLLRLRRADQRRTDLYAFAANSRAGVCALHERAAARGARIVRAPQALMSLGGGFGFQLFDCDGRLVEISAEVEERVPEPVAPKAAVPMGLSHVVFHTPQLKATVAWYEEVLDLRVSDWLGEGMAFLRGGGATHHCVAFIDCAAALNHIAFEMANADEMMRGLGRMLRNEVTLMWGPGRHTAGDNTFAYFVSPAGNIFEYTAEVENLPADWTPRSLPRTPEIMDQWGTGRMTDPARVPPPAADPALWNTDPLGR